MTIDKNNFTRHLAMISQNIQQNYKSDKEKILLKCIQVGYVIERASKHEAI
jgi:hypothetical protein